MKKVVRKEVIKWLDVGIIYLISDSSWVSPVQYVSKKSGITIVENKHGYSGYNQIVVALENQHKTTFIFLYSTFAFREMPFSLCNAPATFQRCMMTIFTDIVENFVKELKRCEETNHVLN
ncbi:RNA-directed DNA polymerase-like protein [Gossypium australe]|uniref:RNA-directed DNA polymerase-like protein n=1 Tax=Gossypium australe TaxID=47621 RepID=A0A5B6VAQ3_9ROSI|nr:RNA-directed DNA polymerase-like protein [Gossypium australe]